MYFLDKEVMLNFSVLDVEKLEFHLVSRVSVDYINAQCEVELSSYPTIHNFLKKESGKVIFFTLNDCPKFDVDPSLFVLGEITQNQASIFFGAEIKYTSDITHISDLTPQQEENENEEVAEESVGMDSEFIPKETE
ncbi:hypothetical protein A1D23_13425 [Chelonobacter oris]|uniref:hypothetical protein n=1 Tax=Chelonobacter oris TaxID=505317 RepID=UPI00244AA3EC|nr:hypothetical protein [Chelonobacter oris]MDH3001634.1 hypothetical protein [Chelonobacter oris]